MPGCWVQAEPCWGVQGAALGRPAAVRLWVGRMVHCNNEALGWSGCWDTPWQVNGKTWTGL